MLMRQDRTADDRKIRIGADRIMREEGDELEKPLKCMNVDLHRDVLSREDDAVLIVVDVRGVLHEPVFSVESERDQADRLACRVVETAGVADIFRAEQAARISVLLLRERSCDRPRILLGLREIDRDVEFTVARLCDPFSVFLNAVCADIVGIAAYFIEIIGRLLRALLIECFEGAHNFGGARCQASHELRVEEVAACDAVLDVSARDCVVEECGENIFKRKVFTTERCEF